MRVLIAEDEPVSRTQLAAACEKWGFTVETAPDGQAAVEILCAEDAPRLALLDWMMPGVDGIEICRRVRARGPGRYTYLVLLTSRDAPRDVVSAFAAGADDYLIKPARIPELHARLEAGRRVMALHDELLDANARLRDLVDRDALTGTLSRGAIVQRLAAEVERAREERSALGLILCDLDRFAEANAFFGTASGDAALQTIAERITARLRPFDVLGRYDGGRFLVLVPGREGLDARGFAEELRETVALPPIPARGGPMRLTASVGVSSWRYGSEPGLEPDALLASVETALERAKAGGRNRVALEQPALGS